MKFREEQVASETVFKGQVLTIVKDVVRCPNGHLATREVVRRCPAATIMAIREDGKIIFERQFRYPYDEEVLELPAGKCDEGEDPATTAIRELEEETGYFAHHLEYLGKMYPSAGYSDEIIHLYLATNLEEKEAHRDENEEMDLLFFDLEEVLHLIKKGEIVDAKTIHAIQLYLLQKTDRLEWGER